jgi:hypothetical protein
MNAVHSTCYANWHNKGQVPINTLRRVPKGSHSAVMEYTFRNALIWHLDNGPYKIAELVRLSGVTRDIINKLKFRENASTDVDNARKIAACYGKTIEQFIRLGEVDNADKMRALSSLLLPEEQSLIEAQIRGILDRREK